MPKAYSAQFRNEMIQKLTSPRGPSVEELSDKVGTHKSTLSRWLREATTMRHVTQDDDDERPASARADRRPQDWTPEERLRVVQAATGLEGSALGAFLRQEGLHEEDLAHWRLQVERGALSALSGTKQRSTEQKRIRKLESELRRKEKALAEAAALLVLSKKARALWGEDEDVDTTGSDDE
jgi:transposase